MSDGGQYQVVVFDALGGYAATLRTTMLRRVAELQLDPSGVVFFDETTLDELDPHLPRVGLLFTGDARGKAFAPQVQRLIENAVVVVPVVRSTDDFASQVPDALWPVNALKLEPADRQLEHVAALVLELFDLLRSRRRLFISYKRKESSAVAGQLHDRLDARFFDVFLDTLSVRAADVFQETLWHRMADSDLVVLLYTHTVLDSGWVAQELERANGMGLTVLQVIWPGVPRDDRTRLLEPYYLDQSSFADAACTRLTDAQLDELTVVVERMRARSLAARESLLVGNLCDLARKHAIEPVVQRTRYVDLHCAGEGPVTRVIAALGVPDAQAVQYCTTLPNTGKKPHSIVLLYDAVSVASEWLAHLAWLDEYLPVKTVRTADLDAWLPNLCL